MYNKIINLILLSHKNKDGLFGVLPLDIIKVLCKTVLVVYPYTHAFITSNEDGMQSVYYFNEYSTKNAKKILDYIYKNLDKKPLDHCNTISLLMNIFEIKKKKELKFTTKDEKSIKILTAMTKK